MRTEDQIRESSVGASTRPLRVDRAKGIIYDVCLLRERGNDDYPRHVREQAARQLEGLRCYVDHGPIDAKRVERSYRDALGFFRGVRERGDGVFAKEFCFNPKHALAEQLCWDAENAPHLLGFSIVGDAVKRRAGSRKVVESITRLDSCDLVSTPAHRGGIFESRGRPTVRLCNLIETLNRRGRHAHAAYLREAASGVMADQDEVETSAPEGDGEMAESDADRALKDGMKAAWAAIFDDGKLDDSAKIAKCKTILQTLAKLSGKPAAAEESRRGTAGSIREQREARAGGWGAEDRRERLARKRSMR